MASKSGREKSDRGIDNSEHNSKPLDYLTFIELRPFSENWHNLGLNDEDLRFVQEQIATNPDKNPVISGTGGLRKMRCGRNNAAKGKSAGYRVCYVYFPEFATVLFVSIYAKNELDDIPAAMKKAFRMAIERIEKQLATRSHQFKKSKS